MTDQRLTRTLTRRRLVTDIDHRPIVASESREGPDAPSLRIRERGELKNSKLKK